VYMLIMLANAYSCSFETSDKTKRLVKKELVTVIQKMVYIVFFNLTRSFGQIRSSPGQKYKIYENISIPFSWYRTSRCV